MIVKCTIRMDVLLIVLYVHVGQDLQPLINHIKFNNWLVFLVVSNLLIVQWCYVQYCVTITSVVCLLYYLLPIG